MLELNKIYCGDCLDLMREMEDKSVDLIVTSPPYNICVDYEGTDEYTLKKQKYINPSSDTRGDEEYVLWLDDVIKECLRISRYTCWNVQWLRSTRNHVTSIHQNFNPNLKEIFIWHKQAVASINWKNGGLAKGWEYVFILGENDKCTFPHNDFPPNGYVPNIQKWVLKDNVDVEHHAMFPLVLPQYFVKHLSKVGNVVLDPFLGSGTTAVACKKLSRNYIGIEKEPAYVEIALKRLEKVNNHKLGDFWERGWV